MIRETGHLPADTRRVARTQHDPTPNLEQQMTDHPYTNEDLRAEAGLALSALVHLPTIEEIVTSLRQSYIPRLHADGDLVTWGSLLDEGELTEAARQIHERMVPATPVGEWAVNLGAEGLEPAEFRLVDGGEGGHAHAAFHIALDPHLEIDARAYDEIADVIRNNLAFRGE